MTERTYQSDLNTDEKVMMAIIRAAEYFKRIHSSVFRNYGLSFPQYNISDVSRIMLVPGANITGLAKRLEKDGFIIKKSDPDDDRVTLLDITPKGKKTLQNIEKEKDKWLELMLKNLSKNEKVELLGIVKQILKNGISLKSL